MRSNKIFLVGMPGSGKSTLGKQLAVVLGYEFVDLDSVIEQNVGMHIPEYFAQNGEAAFRLKETEALEEVTRLEKRVVVATGGGAPCFNNNLNLMNASGTSVYLEVPVATLASRITKQGREKRPLFAGLSEIEFLAKLERQLEVRINFYSKSKVIVPGNAIVVDNISAKLEAKS